MNITKKEIKSFNHLICHRVFPKSETQDAYPEFNENILRLNSDDSQVLKDRLHKAMQNHKKCFELNFSNKNTDSVYSLLHDNYPVEKHDFIEVSKELTDQLATSHFRRRIPGGFCLIGDCKLVSGEKMFFIIKAELQEVFNIANKKLNVIKDVFLSPAKDFYKVGLFIGTSNFTPFIYDDQYTSQKLDLTEYFYSHFLGLSTNENDALLSKNFFKSTKRFIDEYPDIDQKDRTGLYGALTTTFREKVDGLISLQAFADNYLTGAIKDKYLQEFGEKFPIAFTKNISLIERNVDLERISLKINDSTYINGKRSEMDRIEIIEKKDIINSSSDNNSIIINTGRKLDKVVLITSQNEQ
ncbi:hypothetical protein CW751_00055 [Brumimicrobium salinarum]|uniref:Nucleoid-associated protein n=1 Tax=Brumimicrobium salinarum TaxID=2058658 RepID=A0A2I0R5E8_9FLAO|nr:nucleoid-associated protein [Brumimicrobium salinarum]PKR81769.1 hypothetical protein CW751_00055 [Brumimicrobium salinarum]